MEANPFYLQIGHRLIELRIGRGLSQKEAALALEIKDRTYQNYEYGYSKPNTKNLKKIIDYYGCKYMWLISGEGDPFPVQQDNKPLNETANIAESQGKVFYLNPAVRILDEAIRETGATLNEAQKAALMKLLQDELTRAGDKIKDIIKVFKKEG